MATIIHDPETQEDQEKGMLPKLGQQIALIYVWLAGAGMSQQERMNRTLAETEPLRKSTRWPIA